jgi:UDP-N-acetylglucosamine--N-acetylmuramyl-(pentapeptide) pyrophosphoryl-undecaprenol N-acetylglucosamine transferase
MNDVTDSSDRTPSPSLMERGQGVRYIIAGGGTGGHIFPAIAIANALRKNDRKAEILFVGARGKMEMEKVPQAGYKIEGLDIAGFNRSSLIKNAGLPFKLLRSFLQVRRIFNRFRPDAVIGVGGYSSFPVLRYAQSKGIPTYIHESNSFAGRSNMLLGKGAARIFVATDGMEKFFPKEKLVVTGNPVRKDIVKPGAGRADAISFFGLDSRKETVLVIGGSLGARSINEAIAANIEAFKENLQLIWQTGKTDSEKWQSVAKGRKNIWVGEFINKMEAAYEAADIVVSRAGAMALSELCIVKKPVIFVPYPYAAEDHQTENAMGLVKKGAAILVKDSEVGVKLLPAIIDLAANTGRRNELKINISKYAVLAADEHIAMEIAESLGIRNGRTGMS